MLIKQKLKLMKQKNVKNEDHQTQKKRKKNTIIETKCKLKPPRKNKT